MSDSKFVKESELTYQADTARTLPAPEVDLADIEHNLSLSIEERIANHERARKLMLELQAAGVASRERKP